VTERARRDSNPRHLLCKPRSAERRRTSADDCPRWSGRYGLTQPVASTGGRAMDARSDHLLAKRSGASVARASPLGGR
jgi:hypothetical protein